MVKIDYNIDDKLNPAIVGRLVEINPYSARRIYISSTKIISLLVLMCPKK